MGGRFVSTLESGPFATVEEALEEFRAGRMVVVVDDEDRENEGDLTMAAEKITPEAINFMAKYGRGLICLALTEQRLDHLQIPLLVSENTSAFGTAFCQPIDAKMGTTTGISASDRARTILAAVDPATRPADLARPGHMQTLRARNGGVLVRAGQTEASVDMARVAGLIRYRLRTERYVRRLAESSFPTAHGEFRMIVYESDIDSGIHIALVMGEVSGDQPVLVRVHSHCLLGDVFASRNCTCHSLVHRSLEAIGREGRGVLLYLHQSGMGFHIEKLPTGEARIVSHPRPVPNPDEPAFERVIQHESGIGAQILSDLQLKSVPLWSRYPRKVVALEAYGIKIAEHVPIPLTGSAVKI